MHIPDSMLNGMICPVTSIVSTVGVSVASFAAMKMQEKPKASYFAAMTSFVFAVQMMNFPVQNGTSGHLLGGVFAAAMLGIPFGVLSMALVLAIQCLIFSDGGLTVLGANVFNMSIIGAGMGGLIHPLLAKPQKDNRMMNSLALGITAWMSVLLAAFACSIELAISGTIPFKDVIMSMLGIHTLIGIGEGVITVAGYNLFYQSPLARNEQTLKVPFVSAVLIGLLLSPFASGFPDGLEWVAAKYAFLHEAAPAFVGPMPNYVIPAISNEAISTGLSGFLGVLISFAIGWGFVKILGSFKTKEAVI